MIVYDPTGEFTEAFYREGKDILMNPLDSRSPNWNVWNEIRPSAAIPQQHTPVAAAPAPVMQAPVQHAPVAPAPKPTFDPVAETIRNAEAEMERELQMAVSLQQHSVYAPAPAAQPVAQQPAQDEFRPQSRLFAAAPAAPAPQPAPMQTQMHAPAATVAAPRVAPVTSQPAAPVIAEQAAPVIRQTIEPVRMPKVEDFPPVVKAEMEHRSHAAPVHTEERGPMGLLKRITNSLGRRDEEDHATAAAPAAAPAPVAQQRRPLSAEASLYAPRRGQLDDQGRSIPQSAMGEDEQLEIPAFLRRQTN